MRRGGLVGRAIEKLEEFTGYSVVDSEHLRVQEAVAREAWFMAEEMEELGYTSLNNAGSRSSEPSASTRRRWARQARVVWLADPLAGASVELRNEFTFGRGVPKPRAKSKKVQGTIDGFWDDPQNQRVLTSFRAQMRFGNSLSVQANVWFLMFDDGDDGKVKLSYLNHDSVIGAYTDPLNRQRVLFFLASETQEEWDFERNAPKPTTAAPKIRYYEVWGALEDALVERGMNEAQAKEFADKYRAAANSEQQQQTDTPETTEKSINPEEVVVVEELRLPPPSRVGEGKVYHVSENLDMEMVFGVPRMRRTIRWYAAFNEFMAARVDMMQAAASFIMKKTVKGAANTAQVEKIAAKAMRASSDLRTVAEQAVDPSGAVKLGPRPASVLGESGGLTVEPFKLDSGGANATQDGQMLRAQVSAGDRWPQHYLGDVGSSNLATAATMELPALKHVEAFQELAEGVFRWGIDRAIERAVETNKLDVNAADETDEKQELSRIQSIDVNPEVEESKIVDRGQMDCNWRINGKEVSRPTEIILREDGSVSYDLLEAHEDKGKDEASTGLSLDYEFAMPTPTRRLMGDLVTAATGVAQMADPNGENVELTRTLLAFVFAEAFEMQDAADAVDRIFPKGYEPLAVQAMKAQLQPQGPVPSVGDASAARNFFGPESSGTPTRPDQPYGAKSNGSSSDTTPIAEAEVETMTVLGRNGNPIVLRVFQPREEGTVLEEQAVVAEEPVFNDDEWRTIAVEALEHTEQAMDGDDRLARAVERTGESLAEAMRRSSESRDTVVISPPVQPAPRVEVHVPEQAAPVVEVHVPEPAEQPAPIVEVHTHESPRPKGVEVVTKPDGTKEYKPVYGDEGDTSGPGE